MPPRTRIEPNRLDPLSEPTPARRLWAASLKAGYESRSAFARAIDVRNHTLSMFEAEKSFLSLENFATACRLVGYSMEEIYFGRQPRRREPALTLDAIVALCEDLDAAPPERFALKKHLDSPEGALQRITRAYVMAFLDTHANARIAKADPEIAMRKAIVTADNARADSDVIASGANPPSAKYKRQRGVPPAQKRG